MCKLATDKIIKSEGGNLRIELQQIIKRSSAILGIDISDDACLELAKRSRGTPRIANRFFVEARNVSGVNVQSVYNPHPNSVARFAEKWDINP